MATEISDAIIGKPFLWKSELYGNTAVHVTTISQNGKVAVVSIDGGESSKQAQKFPEMGDGIYFAVADELHKRVRTPRKATAALKRAMAPLDGVEITF